MRPRHTDAAGEPHHFAKHFIPLDHGNAHLLSRRNLDIAVRPDSRGIHHDIALPDMLLAVPGKYHGPLLGKLVGHFAPTEVRPGYRIAGFQKQLGNSTHTGPTDANDMHTFRFSQFHSAPLFSAVIVILLHSAPRLTRPQAWQFSRQALPPLPAAPCFCTIPTLLSTARNRQSTPSPSGVRTRRRHHCRR